MVVYLVVVKTGTNDLAGGLTNGTQVRTMGVRIRRGSLYTPIM